MSSNTTKEEVCVDCGPPPSVDKEEQKEDLMDPATFVPPLRLDSSASLPTPLVVIEVSSILFAREGTPYVSSY